MMDGNLRRDGEGRSLEATGRVSCRVRKGGQGRRSNSEKHLMVHGNSSLWGGKLRRGRRDPPNMRRPPMGVREDGGEDEND